MARNNIFDWDELNLLRKEAKILWSLKTPSREQREKFCDWLEFVLCHVYAWGWQGVEDVIGKVEVEWNGDLDTVNIKIAGKTFRDRVLDSTTAEEVIRIIETEATRDYNAGAYNAAKASGRTDLKKRWETMKDDRVRDTHDYLEGMQVGIDDAFYTYDGDSALYPGGFADPANNVNCRCGISIMT